MWNLFKKQSQNKLNFDFESIYNLFQYLTNQESYLSISAKNQLENIEAVWYKIPSSFEDSDAEKKVLKENGFQNFYELLNNVYALSNIGPLNIEEAIKENYQYDIMQINFYTVPNEQEKKWFKKVHCSFYFIFVNENDATNINGYRCYYKRSNTYTLNNLLTSKSIYDLNNPDREDEEYVQQLERNFVALAQHTGITFSKELQNKYPESLLFDAVSVEDFKRIIKLINYNDVLEEDIEKTANSLFQEYQSDWEVLNEEVDYPSYSYFPSRYELFINANLWQSDWKFDPEEADNFIENILDEGLEFEYPEETYSHNLFPYIQKALAPKGLILMNMDAEGDAYNFYLAHKKDIPEIINLSQKLKLGLENI